MTIPREIIEMASNFNADKCNEIFQQYTIKGNHCHAVHDNYSCWPPTPAGETVYLPCPSGIPGVDADKQASRVCLSDGSWFTCDSDNPLGWTNYTTCLAETTLKVVEDLYQEDNICPNQQGYGGSAEKKLLIAKISRIIEVVGYSCSIIFLATALTLFSIFRKLRKPRVTRIHMNLFASMILQSFIRLIIYIDQLIVKGLDSKNSTQGIDNTPILCQTFYTLNEYGKTAMFLWMFIEGIYLHHLCTVAFSRGPENRIKFYLFGWLAPIPLMIFWTIANLYEDNVDQSYCGYDYALVPTYWILEGPRTIAILINMMILVNVIRILFGHLSDNLSNDMNNIRKSVKSLFLLLPLLGIINILHFLWPNPLRGSWISFMIWSISTYFLFSFQGTFVACIYFFCDEQIQSSLRQIWNNRARLKENNNSIGQQARDPLHSNSRRHCAHSYVTSTTVLQGQSRNVRQNFRSGRRESRRSEEEEPRSRITIKECIDVPDRKDEEIIPLDMLVQRDDLKKEKRKSRVSFLAKLKPKNSESREKPSRQRKEDESPNIFKV